MAAMEAREAASSGRAGLVRGGLAHSDLARSECAGGHHVWTAQTLEAMEAASSVPKRAAKECVKVRWW